METTASLATSRQMLQSKLPSVLPLESVGGGGADGWDDDPDDVDASDMSPTCQYYVSNNRLVKNVVM